MGWKCYSCGPENSKKDASCKKCGNTVAAPKEFYAGWIIGAALFFMVFYLAGTMAGGVVVEAVATPSQDSILKIANEQKNANTSEFESLLQLKPDELASAKAVAIQRSKASMSPIVVGILQWMFPVILFVICGIIVGFVSDGKTIIEPALGSILGQALAAVIMLYVFKSDATSWLIVGIGALPGAGLGILGAWLGEVIQEKKERAGGITA